MRSAGDTCEYCRYFERVTEDTGLCRRYAPRPRLVEVQNVSDDLPARDFVPLWPSVANSDWCGEQKR